MILNSLIILLALLILNFYLYKFIYKDKKLLYISSAFMIIYYLITLIIYKNNINSGFEYGILFGDIENNHFCDEYRYFKDSDILLNHFKNGDLSLWLSKELPVYEYIDPQGHPGFGNYNIFVIIITLLKLLGINDIVEIVTLKIAIYIPTFIFLYKLCKIYLDEKSSLLVVTIYSLLPGFLLMNSLLMRDSFIILLCIIAFYCLLNKKINFYLLIPTLLLLLLFRSYIIPIIIFSYVITFKNKTKILSLTDILAFIIIFIAIIFFSTHNFNNSQMRILQENFAISFGSGFIAPIKVFIYTFIQILYNPPLLNFLTSGSIYLIIFSLGNIVSILISCIFAIRFIYIAFTTKNSNIICLLKVTFYFTVITGILVLSKDGYIINRIELMWLPLFLIVTLLPAKKENVL